MVRTEWYPVSTKINQHFKENVFVISQGPDFREWLQAETGGKIIQVKDPMVIEFANYQDYTAFLLKWS
jgi:hypothetical protein